MITLDTAVDRGLRAAARKTGAHPDELLGAVWVATRGLREKPGCTPGYIFRAALNAGLTEAAELSRDPANELVAPSVLDVSAGLLYTLGGEATRYTYGGSPSALFHRLAKAGGLTRAEYRVCYRAWVWGVPLKEVARVLRMTETRARTLACRARRKIRGATEWER